MTVDFPEPLTPTKSVIGAAPPRDDEACEGKRLDHRTKLANSSPRARLTKELNDLNVLLVKGADSPNGKL